MLDILEAFPFWLCRRQCWPHKRDTNCCTAFLEVLAFHRGMETAATWLASVCILSRSDICSVQRNNREASDLACRLVSAETLQGGQGVGGHRVISDANNPPRFPIACGGKEDTASWHALPNCHQAIR